jgi:hypothetical protein
VAAGRLVHFYQALLYASNVIILDGLLFKPTDRLADSGNLHAAGRFAQLMQG